MPMTVSIQLSGSSATYKIKHKVESIYEAILADKKHQLLNQFPEKIILLRVGGGPGFVIAKIKK